MEYSPDDREMLIGVLGGECSLCGEEDPEPSHANRSDGFEVHHVNGDRRDNSAANLRLLCISCHRALHANGGDMGYRDEETLREKVSDGHTVKSLAAHFDVSDTTIHNYLQEHGIDADYS